MHAANQGQGLRVYRYLRDDLGARHLQFIPVVERVPAGQAALAEGGWRDADGRRSAVPPDRRGGHLARSVAPRAWGEFLCSVFDEWLAHDVGEVFVQHVEATLGNLFGRPSMCVHAPTCGTALAVEPDGSVYACDHFVEPGYRRGAVATVSLGAILDAPRQRAFGRAKLDGLPRLCRECDVR